MIDRRNREKCACVAQTYADHAAAPFPPIPAGVERAPALEMDSLGETRAGTSTLLVGSILDSWASASCVSTCVPAIRAHSHCRPRSWNPRRFVIHGIGIHVVVEGGHLQDLLMGGMPES